MPQFETRRLVKHSPDRMYALVADIERYPEFLPLCEALAIRSRRERDGKELLLADMTVGYKAIRAQTGVPGIKDAYGVGRGKLYYEPADAELPSVTGWDTRKALNYVPKMFEELRKTYGFDHHLLHDGHHRYTPQEAANLGKMLEPYQLFWFEDYTPAENQEAFKLVRQHTTTPLAVGEIFNTIWDAKDLIQNQLID